jgi:predicted phosphodiesterase
MKIGILADIHEHVGELRSALAVLNEHGADRLVILGDVCERNRNLDETVAILEEAGAVGVWGNHDFGLCGDGPRREVRGRFGGRVLAFMSRLQPRLEVEGCLFTHVEPWLDPEKVEDLWYFDGPPETPEQVARIFAATTHRVMFVGHYHRWLLVTPEGIQPWAGDAPVILDAGDRHLVVINAVCQGKCALFDTATGRLTPFDLSHDSTRADSDDQPPEKPSATP